MYVAIGRDLRPFPRSKPCGPLSRHTAFRTRPSGTMFNPIDTRSMPLMVSFRTFQPHDVSVSEGLLVPVTFLADLRHVRPITGRHLATMPPPPSFSRAGIFAPHLSAGQAISEFPNSNHKRSSNR